MATVGIPLWSTTAASNASADPAVNWAEGMAPSAVNDSGRGMMASVAKWRDDLYGLTTAGTSTAFTVTTNATYATAAAMSGAVFTIIPNATSGAAPTLAVDGLTARALNVSTGVAVPTGALVSGTPYLVKYVHASTEFIVLGVVGKGLLSALDIINGTSETTIASDDTLPIYDLSATANRQMLVSDFLKVVNALTADSSPDSAADYVMTYDTSATAAKKVLIDDFPKGAQPPAGLFKNLSITVASNTTVTVAADYVTTTDGSLFKTTAVSSTVNLGTTGADALDAGTVATSTWYAIWVIAKADGTTKSLASTSATAPTMPTDYTYKARVGWVLTHSSSAILVGTRQRGRMVQFVVGLAATGTSLPIALTLGASSAAWTAVSLSGLVPSTASAAGLVVGGASVSSGGVVAIAPNNNYDTTITGAFGVPYYRNIGVSGNLSFTDTIWIMLESTNVYYGNNGAFGLMYVLGWEDNL